MELHRKGKVLATLERSEVIRSLVIIHLSFCMRWSLKPEWDGKKILIVEGLLPKRDKVKEIWNEACYEVSINQNAMLDAIRHLHPSLHEFTFLSCARIVSRAGFEEDARQLAELKEALGIPDDRADILIDLAKQEAFVLRQIG